MQGVQTPPVPGIVDYEAALELTPREIVRQVMSRQEESKAARRSLENQWERNLDLYHSRQDFSSKSEWQAQLFMPLVFTKVETFKSLVKSALLGSSQWFGLEGDEEFLNSGKQRFLEKLLGYMLEEGKFVQHYMHALEEGAVFGTGCLAFQWRQYVDRCPYVEAIPVLGPDGQPMIDPMSGQPVTRDEIRVGPRLRSGLVIRHVPIWAVYPDPYAPDFDRCKYIIEEMAQDEEDLQDGVEAGMYDSIDDIGSPVAWDLESEKRTLYTELNSGTPRDLRKRHLLTIYHGDFVQDGKVVLKNWRAIVANKRALIAFGPNLNYTGRRPYLFTTPLRFKGRPWGRDIIGPAENMQLELNHIVNLAMDAQTLSSLPITETDVSKMAQPIDFASIEPGKNYQVTGPGAITPVKISMPPNDVWPMVTKLEQSIAMAMGINEFVEGSPTTKGRPTATEVTQKSGASQAQIQNMAADLEDSDLTTAVKLAYELAMQNLDDVSDPKLQDILQGYKGPMDLSNPVLRFRLLDAKFRVRVRGISISLKRESQIQKLMQLQQMSQQMGLPPANTLAIFYMIAQAMQIDPTSIGLPPSPQAAMEQQQAMMAAQQQGAGGAGGGSGVAPAPPSTGAPPAPNSPEAMMNQLQNQVPAPPPM